MSVAARTSSIDESGILPATLSPLELAKTKLDAKTELDAKTGARRERHADVQRSSFAGSQRGGSRWARHGSDASRSRPNHARSLAHDPSTLESESECGLPRALVTPIRLSLPVPGHDVPDRDIPDHDIRVRLRHPVELACPRAVPSAPIASRPGFRQEPPRTAAARSRLDGASREPAFPMISNRLNPGKQLVFPEPKNKGV